MGLTNFQKRFGFKSSDCTKQNVSDFQMVVFKDGYKFKFNGNDTIPLQLQIGNKQLQIGNKQFQIGNKQYQIGN